MDSLNTFGWKPDTALNDDTNYMDLTLLVTRNSRLRQGSMACILVGPTDNDAEQQLPPLKDRIIGIANNEAFYSKNGSDVHAEIAALGVAARHGRKTLNSTAYITMPPCKNCLVALHAAGIRKIVSRKGPNKSMYTEELLVRKGMEYLVVEEDRTRINAIVAKYKEEQLSKEDGNEENVRKRKLEDESAGAG